MAHPLPVVGVLLPPTDRSPPPPEALPIGRAALALADRATVLVGAEVNDGVLAGYQAVPGAWRPMAARPHAIVDRFPSFTRPDRYHALLHGLGAVPIHNPPGLTALLRDKLRTQTVLADLGMPPVEADPRRFSERLAAWGAAFHKPRFGSFGRGITRVDTPPSARAQVDGVDQPMLLQAAVPPPTGYAGVALRILVQRSPDGPVAYPPVARLSSTDPVVNRARGAEVTAAEERFGASVAEAAQALALRVLQRFPGAIELGVDAVLDPELHPHLIEVNARPRGRLAALAERDPGRYGPLHDQACVCPLLTVFEMSDTMEPGIS